MINYVRSAYHKEGKGQEAWAWVIKLATYVNETYEDVSVQLNRNFNGPTNQVHWVQAFGSLAEVDAFIQKLNKDEKWAELYAQGEELWTGRIDNYYVTVP
jgi:hypothetical protein